jgi:hypothetical protein
MSWRSCRHCLRPRYLPPPASNHLGITTATPNPRRAEPC